MNYLELFSGYGTSSFALKRLNIDARCIGYSDIDKYANQCFKQNHNGVELGDVKLINPNNLADFDLLTGGFPCQAFSNAGKQLGELDSRGTLFYEIIRIAEIKKPKYILLENVKGLCSKKFKNTFDKILSELDRIGYNVYWKVLNSKDYGIPQSRARVWFVCIRKDIDIKKFEFPKETELKISVKDILEKEVDDKYFISEKCKLRLIKNDIYIRELLINKNICQTLRARDYKGRKIIQLNNPKHSNDRISDENTISPCLNTCGGGDRQPFILIKNATKQGYVKAKENDFINLEFPESNTRRGRVSENCNALQLNDQRGIITKDLNIRKLTPKEYFRLMGFLKDEINLDGLSDSRKYKLAGNGQDVNIVSLILKNMLIKNY